MLCNTQLIIIVGFTLLVGVSQTTSIAQFAFFSELLWLSVYTSIAMSTGSCSEILAASAPFLVLVLTAVEAVVLWTLIVLK